MKSEKMNGRQIEAIEHRLEWEYCDKHRTESVGSCPGCETIRTGLPCTMKTGIRRAPSIPKIQRGAAQIAFSR